MARDFNGTDEWLQVNTAPVTSYPMSMACWFRPADLTTSSIILCLSDKDDNDNYTTVGFKGDTAGDPVYAEKRGVNLTDQILSSGSVTSTSNWYHLGGTFTTTTQAVFLDGSKDSESQSHTTAGIDNFTIGRLTRGGTHSPTGYYPGEVCHAAVWNVELTDAEMAALANRVHPFAIRPNALVAYVPLWGESDPEPDYVSGNGLTVNGSPSKTKGVSLVLPHQRSFFLPSGTSTFTGSGTPSSQAATLSGSGTFTAPVYTGSGTPSSQSATLAGSGTFTAPVYTGSGTPSAGAATLAASGTFTAPVYTGSGTVSSQAATLSGSGNFATWVGTGNGSLSAQSATTSGSGTFTAPVYTGSGSLAVANSTLAASGTFTAPVFTGSGSLTGQSATLTAAGVFATWVGTGSGSPSSQSATLAASGTFSAPSGLVSGPYYWDAGQMYVAGAQEGDLFGS